MMTELFLCMSVLARMVADKSRGRGLSPTTSGVWYRAQDLWWKPLEWYCAIYFTLLPLLTMNIKNQVLFIL